MKYFEIIKTYVQHYNLHFGWILIWLICHFVTVGSSFIFGHTIVWKVCVLAEHVGKNWSFLELLCQFSCVFVWNIVRFGVHSLSALADAEFRFFFFCIKVIFGSSQTSEPVLKLTSFQIIWTGYLTNTFSKSRWVNR